MLFLLFLLLMSQLGSISKSEVPMKVVYIIYVVLHNQSMRHLDNTLRVVHVMCSIYFFLSRNFGTISTSAQLYAADCVL